MIPEVVRKGPLTHINCKKFTCRFIVVDVDSLQLEVGVAVVGAGWVNAVLVGDHLPELE